jgi:hypothetical protein
VLSPEPWLLRVAEAGDLDLVARPSGRIALRGSVFRGERPPTSPGDSYTRV